MMNGDVEGAITDFTTLIESPMDTWEAKDSKAVYYWNRGLVKQVKRDWDGAIADYSEALKLKPGYAEAAKGLDLVKKAKENH